MASVCSWLLARNEKQSSRMAPVKVISKFLGEWSLKPVAGCDNLKAFRKISGRLSRGTLPALAPLRRCSGRVRSCHHRRPYEQYLVFERAHQISSSQSLNNLVRTISY